MEWSDFYKSVKDGEFQSVYLFTGPEELNKQKALEALRKALLPAGLEALNEVRLDGAGIQAIIDAAVTMPVMCDRRLVVVRDWPLLLKGKVKNEEEEAKRFVEWLKDVPDSCCVVFYTVMEMDGRKKAASALKKLPGYVEFSHISGDMLLKWCSQQLKPYRKKISRQTVDEMALMAGSDLTRLSGELKKLVDFVGDAEEITAADVRRIVSPTPEYSVFEILDLLLSGKLAQACKVVENLMQNGSNAVQLIMLLGGQLRLNTHVKLADEARRPLTPEAMQRLKVSSGRLYHIRRQIKNVPAAELKKRYLKCVETEHMVKSGKLNEKIGLNALMMELLFEK